MIDYRARRKRIEQFRFVAICLCIIMAIIMLFSACTPHTRPVPTPWIIHDTVRVVRTDTVTKTIELPPVVVHDTVQTVHTDTVQIKVTNVIRDTVQVVKTDTLIREKRDTLVLRDALTLRDTIVRTVFDTITKHDSTVILYPVHDTTIVKVPVHDTTVVTITKIVHDTIIVVRVDTVQVPAIPGQPELPRYMNEMDAMLRAARASDTVTRQVFDQDPVTKALVARKDSTGAFVCNRIVITGGKEQPIYFPCPQAILDAVKARSIVP